MCASSKPKTFQVSFNELNQMRGVVNSALKFIDKHKPDLDQENLGDMKLILNELLCNAIVHGNKKDKEKNVYLKLEIKDNSIHSKIIDEGNGFDYKKLVAQNQDYLSKTKESGRGVKLACSLTNALAFNSLGNEIKFVKDIKKHV